MHPAAGGSAVYATVQSCLFLSRQRAGQQAAHSCTRPGSFSVGTINMSATALLTGGLSFDCRQAALQIKESETFLVDRASEFGVVDGEPVEQARKRARGAQYRWLR